MKIISQIILLIIGAIATCIGALLVNNGPPVHSISEIDADFFWATTILFTGAFCFLASIFTIRG